MICRKKNRIEIYSEKYANKKTGKNTNIEKDSE